LKKRRRRAGQSSSYSWCRPRAPTGFSDANPNSPAWLTPWRKCSHRVSPFESVRVRVALGEPDLSTSSSSALLVDGALPDFCGNGQYLGKVRSLEENGGGRQERRSCDLKLKQELTELCKTARGGKSNGLKADPLVKAQHLPANPGQGAAVSLVCIERRPCN
jgi:hypothetical protein